MNVVVIGAEGFYGKALMRVLSRRLSVPPTPAGRSPKSGGIHLDLNVPSTFVALDRFDVVFNVSDSLSARPDDAIAHCLSRGKTFVDCSGDAATVERLLHAYARQSQQPGRLLLGAGLFPGLSNVLARSVVATEELPRSIECAVRSSPFSGAGQGMRRLMVSALLDNAVAFQDGQRVEFAPGKSGPRMRFFGKELPTLRVSFAEVPMLRHSTQLAHVATYFVPKPAWLLLGMRMLARSGALHLSLAHRLMLGMLKLLRGWLLKGFPTAVTITAVANRHGQKLPQGDFSSVHVSDGMEAAACVAVALWELSERAGERRGLLVPDELAHIDELLTRMRELAGPSLKISQQRESGPGPTRRALLPINQAR